MYWRNVCRRTFQVEYATRHTELFHTQTHTNFEFMAFLPYIIIVTYIGEMGETDHF